MKKFTALTALTTSVFGEKRKGEKSDVATVTGFDSGQQSVQMQQRK
jgi:hypothetical protein